MRDRQTERQTIRGQYILGGQASRDYGILKGKRDKNEPMSGKINLEITEEKIEINGKIFMFARKPMGEAKSAKEKMNEKVE